MLDIKNVVAKLTVVDSHNEHASQSEHSLNVLAVWMAVEPVIQRDFQPLRFLRV